MKNNKKHILFLPAWYPNKTDSMWGLFVQKHAEAISLFHKISVLYLMPLDEGQENEEWIEDKKNGIHTLYIYYPKPKNKITYFYKFIQTYSKGLNYLNKKQNIDLIHVHILTRMGILASLSYFIYKIPFVITEHWSRYLPNVNTYKGSLRKTLTSMVVKKAKAVLPVTANLKSAMIARGLKNDTFVVVPNVVDDIFFDSQLKTNSSTKRIIHVSTFEDKSKNISGIIDAIEKIKEERKDFKLVLIGDGMDFKTLKHKVASKKLDEYIEFTGLLEKEALIQEFEKASFLLINSNYENMPVVINEAFACGLPVLSTDVGGIKEHLSPSRGQLIPANQPTQLVEQINWMLEHFQEYDSSEIKQYAMDHFSMNSVGKQINKVYQDSI